MGINIHPELRSTLLAIQLLTVVKYDYVKTYGIDRIMKPIIDGVSELENVCMHVNTLNIKINRKIMIASYRNLFILIQGLELAIGNKTEIWYGTITIFSADNLASQYIGGYKQLASALRKCRFCMATDDQVQSKVRMYIYVCVVRYTRMYVQHTK